MAEIEEELKSLLMRFKEESENADLKLNIHKTKIMASGPMVSWQINTEKVETVADFCFLGLQITVDVTAAVKLKDTCSLEGKLWQTLVSSVTQSCPTLCNPWTAACQASLSITNSQSLLNLMSIKSVMPSNHLIFCCPLLLLPSIFPSIRVFSNESVLCIRWPKYCSFSFSISHSSEYSGLISLKIDWFDLLTVQRTLKHLLQHHSSKAWIL